MPKAKRMTYFKANLEDQPGTLLRIMEELKTKKISLTSLWGFGTQGGKAQVFTVSKDTEELRDLWKASGLLAEEGTGFFIRGTDRPGALVKTLQALAEAGTNIRAMHAIAVGGRYGSFVWVEPGDVEKVAQALGAK